MWQATSFGAFLLVAATVLFELYGTVGLDGEVRLGAVVALNLIFAAAGYLANRRERLRSVGAARIATPGAGIVLRSRVLLAGGGIALALVSLRALLTVAQAGF